MQHAPPRPRSRLMAALHRHGLVLALAGLCLAVELVLEGAERGLWGSSRWRVLAYLNGGFWAGLVRAGWEGNYALQPVTMFVSYTVLHAGFAHLATNLIALLALGAAVRARVGQTGQAGLLAASALGGGLAFAAFGPLGQPMVGASGALFGLVGALIVWRAAEERRAGRLPWEYIAAGAALMGLNVLSAWAVGWQMAWEAHLGGFIAGGLAALAIRPRRHPG